MYRFPYNLSSIAIFLLLIASGDVSAGKLDSFERSANQNVRSGNMGRERHSDSCISDILGEIIGDVVGQSLVYSGGRDAHY